MSAEFNFILTSEDPKRDLPRKIIIGRRETETAAHVLLKLLGFVLFHRERLQMEVNLHMDSIPFIPDLVELDYELRPKLWVECGECSVSKLNKLAVKVPEAEIWVIKRSEAAAQDLARAMAKADLRRERYNLIGLDHEMFDEMCGLLHTRNELFWVRGVFDPPLVQFDFNGLWFDAAFTIVRF
jgi:uncharacterized protein YaeQ